MVQVNGTYTNIHIHTKEQARDQSLIISSVYLAVMVTDNGQYYTKPLRKISLAKQSIKTRIISFVPGVFIF